MSKPEKNARKPESQIQDLEPKATDGIKGGLSSNVQKKLDDTISGQQQKIG